MGAIFILGNGFDLAHGLPSNYSDFKKYIIREYPDAKNDFGYRLYLEDYEEMSDVDFSSRLIVFAMNKTAGKDWNNFEDSLGYLTFQEKFPTRSKEDQEIDDEDDIMSYLKACELIANLIKESTYVWQNFFSNWLKEVNGQIKNTCEKNVKLAKCFEGNNLFLSFNYTTVLEDLYGIKSVTHIHKKVGQQLIFGHGYNEPPINVPPISEPLTYKPFVGSSTLDDIIMQFKKDSGSVMRKNISFFRSIKRTIDRVYSFGFSYSKPDAEYIKAIIKRISPEATWFFTEYESNDTENLRVKKVKLRNYGFKGQFGVF